LLPHVLPHRHRLRGRLLRHLYRAPHPRGQEPPPAVRAAHGAEGSLGAGRGERAPGAAAVTQSAGDDPPISPCRSCLRTLRRQDLLEAGGGAGAGADARVFQQASRLEQMLPPMTAAGEAQSENVWAVWWEGAARSVTVRLVAAHAPFGPPSAAQGAVLA